MKKRKAKKIAVVYFSETGNTKTNSRADCKSNRWRYIYEIVPSEAYTDKDMNYNSNNSRANMLPIAR